MDIKKLFQGLVFIALILFIFVYNDTAEFQSIMKMIFGSDSYSPTENWLDNRAVILSALLFLLVLYYFSVWRTYGKLIHSYRSPLTQEKPPISAQQASYLYLHKPYLNVAIWIIEQVLSGVLTLYYKKGVHPWSVSHNAWKLPASEFDKTLLDILFKHEEIKAIEDYSDEPDPDFKKVADNLYKKIEKENQHLMQHKSNSLLAWLLVIIFLFELPSINTLYPNSPGLVAIGVMLSISTGFVTYAICKQLPSFFNDNKIMAWLVSGIFILITGIFHWGGLGIYDSLHWHSTFIYLELVVVIAVSVSAIPKSPNNYKLLSQVIAYQKYLSTTKEALIEDDLPWIVGLDTEIVFSSLVINFKDNKIPYWLKSEEIDLKTLMQEFHETFTSNVNKAVNGRQKSSSFSNHSDGLSGREI